MKEGYDRKDAYECRSCGTVLVVSFSCKSRLCLSCYRKMLFGWSLNLSRILNPALAYSHVIFTVPGQVARLLFVHRFQPITGKGNDVLFRNAEYIASGFFHNSQILKVDDSKKEIAFRFRSWVDHQSIKKYCKNIKMDIFEFMTRMLYFLSDHRQKSIRYYVLCRACDLHLV